MTKRSSITIITTPFLWFWRFMLAVMWVPWTVLRPAIRFISAVLMIAAVFTFVADITRWQIGDMQPLFHSLIHHVNVILPATSEHLEKVINGSSPLYVWNYGLHTILYMPAWLLFSLTSLGFGLVSRERKHSKIFIN